MPVPNNKYTYFSATTVAQTVVLANPARRRLNIYSYSQMEETDPNSVWYNSTSNAAVPFQCMQLVPGAAHLYGGTSDYNVPLRLEFQSCPTGAVSVVTSAGTHRGVIEEFV